MRPPPPIGTITASYHKPYIEHEIISMDKYAQQHSTSNHITDEMSADEMR
jgi:hypothetical protein